MKAVSKYEKTNSRSTFDPDGDNFNFGYEMALTMKVRLNLMKMIRKEIFSSNNKFWDWHLESLK